VIWLLTPCFKLLCFYIYSKQCIVVIFISLVLIIIAYQKYLYYLEYSSCVDNIPTRCYILH